MNNPISAFIAPSGTPPWLPREVAEGRRFAWWAQIMFLLMAVLWFVIFVVMITLYVADGGAWRLALGLFGIFGMLICFLAGIFLKKTVLDPIDQGRFHDAKNDTLIWIVMGLFAFVVPSLFLILTYAKLGDALVSQAPVGYAPYAAGNVAVQQPGYVPPPMAPTAAPPAPVQPAGQPAAAFHAHQTPMHRCKNCNVQYPDFMHSCPNCGAPK